MADLNSQTSYGTELEVSSATSGTPATAANIVRLSFDTTLDPYTQRRTSDELGRTSVEVDAMMKKAKAQLLDYIADLNS